MICLQGQVIIIIIVVIYCFFNIIELTGRALFDVNISIWEALSMTL